MGLYRGVRAIGNQSRGGSFQPELSREHDAIEDGYVAQLGDDLADAASKQILINLSGAVPTMVGGMIQFADYIKGASSGVASAGGASARGAAATFAPLPAAPPGSGGRAAGGASAIDPRLAHAAASFSTNTPRTNGGAAETAGAAAYPGAAGTGLGGAAGSYGGGRRRRHYKKTHKRRNHKRRVHKTKKHPKRR
jgi:hypothetical protein